MDDVEKCCAGLSCKVRFTQLRGAFRGSKWTKRGWSERFGAFVGRGDVQVSLRMCNPRISAASSLAMRCIHRPVPELVGDLIPLHLNKDDSEIFRGLRFVSDLTNGTFFCFPACHAFHALLVCHGLPTKETGLRHNQSCAGPTTAICQGRESTAPGTPGQFWFGQVGLQPGSTCCHA